MLTPQMVDVINRVRLGFVATVSADGRPNLSPKGTFVVIDATTLAFAEIRSPQTITNLSVSPVIEVNFVDPLTRKGLRATGPAVVIGRGADLFNGHIARFDPWPTLAPRIRHIVLISIEHAARLSSPIYDDGAVEAEVREQWRRKLLDQ